MQPLGRSPSRYPPMRLPSCERRLPVLQFSLGRLMAAMAGVALSMLLAQRLDDMLSQFAIVGSCWGFAMGMLWGGPERAVPGALVGAALGAMFLPFALLAEVLVDIAVWTP